MPRKSSEINYEVSIPGRKQILAWLGKCKSPRQLAEIARALGVKTSAERAALNKRLKAMLRDGEIIRNRREGYGLLKKMDLIAGRVIGHPDGYGFCRPDDGSEDLYLSIREMRKIMHGDHVVVRQSGSDRQGRREGAVVEMLEPANKTVIGKYFRENSIGFVVPDNRRISQDILVPAGKTGKARKGQVVVVEITRQPDKHTQPIGRIIEVLGSSSSIDMAIDIALRAWDIPRDWPAEVLSEADKLQAGSSPGRRKDLRDLNLVTIDGEDARDFDDAVYCEPRGKGWRLIVAIADVSHYVRPGMELDKEAERRGTSVYFPGRVVPMLPEQLSNDLCSLKPEVDRLAMVCDMNISERGKISNREFYPARIRSRARLVYTEVDSVLQGTLKKHPRRREIKNLHTLYGIMHKRREELGLLDFATTETVLEIGSKGKVIDIHAVARNDAHRLIEEFMLAANISAAAFLLQSGLPCLYRNHERPAEEKLDDLNEFLSGLGLQLRGGKDPGTKDYAKLMDIVESRDDRHLIEMVLLRSMPLAVYEGKNKGHFGLAFDAYTHFTSPIRRYPDLVVHRAIRSLIRKSNKYPYTATDIHNLGLHCSTTERRAEEASRDVMQRMKCEFMLDKIGRKYRGTVTGVTGFGLFVELDDIYVEGLVHVTSLPDDYYHFDAVARSLTGEKTGNRYYPGDRIQVRVSSVDTDERKIDFELVRA